MSVGAEVTIAVRNLEAGRTVMSEIVESSRNAAVHVAPLDLNDCASIAAFVDAWDEPLDILVNNAGVMALP